ncbi:MAG: nucleoside 2-deoxyribosyltransferase domain-containing protein [Planctomycetota bacterium]
MQYIEAPYEYTGDTPSVFLAGGITGTAVWQYRLTAMLCDTGWAVVNPRRNEFPMEDSAVGREQIAWEFRHLQRTALIAFWFPYETLCPITLYELGSATRMDKPILVGADPDYERRFDLEAQLKLIRPEVKVVDKLGKLAEQIIDAEPGGTPTTPKEAALCVP